VELSHQETTTLFRSFAVPARKQNHMTLTSILQILMLIKHACTKLILPIHHP